MNLYNELNSLIESGIKPMIEFTKFAEDLDSGVECGMRGVVETICKSKYDDDCFEVTINMEQFFDYNKQFMTHTWLNKITGEYDATSIEAGWYPKNHIVDIFDSMNDQDEYNFVLLANDNNKLYEEYETDKLNNETYVSWLERKLLDARK